MPEGAYMLPPDVIETLARAMHENYLRNQHERGGTLESNPSMVAWEELPETLRESNRDQARHIGVKLAAVGRRIEPLEGGEPEPLNLSAEEVERLAEMEHERWWREREAAGWTYAAQKDIDAKKSPHLVPYKQLSEEIREYDRDTVRGLPAFLVQAGFRIIAAANETEDDDGKHR